RLDALSDPGQLSGLDENDPRSVARWMRRMGQEAGDDVRGAEFDQMVDELESGGDGDGDLGDPGGTGDPGDDGGSEGFEGAERNGCVSPAPRPPPSGLAGARAPAASSSWPGGLMARQSASDSERST